MGKTRLEALFVSQAGATPDRLAILHNGRGMTYRDLDRRSNQIAHHLASHGAGPSTLVAICIPRSIDMIACLLGILKTGAAYVPVDPDYPQERIDYILDDSGAEVLVTASELTQQVQFSGRRIELERLACDPNEGHVEPLVTPGDAESLAYIIYTSGTTGKPKGVMLSHTASALVDWARQTFTGTEMSRMAATSSICFDPSILEIFVPLCLGGTVVLKANSLESFSVDELPTMINVVPAVLEQILKSEGLPKSIQVINVGGERVKASLARRVYKAAPQVQLYNHYGPTEATTCTTVALVEHNATEDPPIGIPICGARVYVLDEAHNAVDTGVTGEIYIAGPTLAQGYRNLPELTLSKFLRDLDPRSGEKMYRTGDLGYWTKEGDLRYVGRVDDQVKFRGVRIELGEIEANLRALPAVENASAAVRLDQTGRERLVAYIELGQASDPRQVRALLEQKLPKQMLPSHFVVVQQWPLNLSGKVDRQALPDPIWEAPAEERVPPAGSALEDLIANSFRYAIGIQHVGPDDNFFEIGGDSLLAEEVMLELERILNISIPATMFAQNSTPRLLAAVCYLEPLTEMSHIVSLQPKGTKLPLFCAPDVFGLPLSFMSLARSLAPDQPVYGLSTGPLEAAVIAEPSIEMLTAAYVREVRLLQPKGPYQVCGYSFGGTAAFDLAQALKMEGEDVSLILLDSVISQGVSRLRPLFTRAELAQKRGIRKVVGLLKRSRREWLKLPQLILARDIPDWVPMGKRDVALALAKAKSKYRYRPFDGNALLVECAIPDANYTVLNRDGMLGWSGLLTGPIVQIRAETSHPGLMRDPYAKRLAIEIESFLERVSSTPS